MIKVKGILSTIAIGLMIHGVCGVACAAENKTTKTESIGAAVFQQASPSVLLVKSKTSNGSLQGSGVVFRNGFTEVDKSYKPVASWVVTNAHVVAGGTSVIVSVGNNTYPADVKYTDETLDLALLWVPNAVLSPAKVINANKVAVGERVFAIGSPLGLENSISEGILSGHREYKGANVLQTTAPISSGNSGGGLFDSKSRLIGITTFKLKTGESLNFAIDSNYINILMDAYGATGTILTFMEALGGVDEWQANPSRLTRWLMTTKSDNGKLIYEYFNQKFMRAFDVSDDKAQLTRNLQGLMDEIKEYYLRKPLVAQGSTGNTLAPKQAEGIHQGYRLTCPMFVTSSGEFFRDLNFNVSVAENKVNNLPASFTSDAIVFRLVENGKFQVRLDRYTGIAIYGTSESPNFARGQCVKVEQRQL